MAISLQLLDGVRFFDNGREIVAVPASYAETYLKAKRYSNKEVSEISDLVSEIADGRTISFWSGSIGSVASDLERLCLCCMNNFIPLSADCCSECEHGYQQIKQDA